MGHRFRRAWSGRRTGRAWVRGYASMDAVTGVPLAVLRGTRRRFGVWSGRRMGHRWLRRALMARCEYGTWQQSGASRSRGMVWDVVWSPDGARLARVLITRCAYGMQQQGGASRPEYTDWVKKVWSPDGDRLASASSDHTVRVWDAATGMPLAILEGHTSEGVFGRRMGRSWHRQALMVRCGCGWRRGQREPFWRDTIG